MGFTRVVLLVMAFVDVGVPIDMNEAIGRCQPNLKFSETHYIHENEGVWFPQYRTRQAGNERYSCHTVYERMDYKHGFKLSSNIYFTREGKIIKDPFSLDYEIGEEKGVLEVPQFSPVYGPYSVFNIVFRLTPEYRVRYVCTNFMDTPGTDPLVIIETRNFSPNKSIIDEAAHWIQQSGLSIVLDRIQQRNCTRPLTDKGYDYEKANSQS